MEKTVFDFQDYKKYLIDVEGRRPSKGRGFRSQLAEAAGCQRTFISQVLEREAHLSLEQGLRINSLLEHDAESAHYFLLLIQYNRAGTAELRQYFMDQMQFSVTRRLKLKHRLKTQSTLSIEDQARYYGSWLFGAIRVALGVPGLRDPKSLSKYFKVDLATVEAALAFLEARNLVRRHGTEFVTTVGHLHLADDSPFISRHHLNWRMKAVQSLEAANPADLHYSTVMTVSNDDAVKLKSMLVDYVEKVQKKVADSKDESVRVLCLDFFDLR